MNRVIVVLSFLVIIISSCKKEKNTADNIQIIELDTNSEETTSNSDANYETVELNVSFSDSRYNDAYKHYIYIKNALVNSDVKGAMLGGQNIGTAFANIGVEQVLIEAAGTISAGEDIKVQRKAFSVLSNELTKLLSGAHIASGKIYKQFCPMAFDFKGGFWLSTEKEIRNPYFGDAMLECGEVKETLE